MEMGYLQVSGLYFWCRRANLALETVPTEDDGVKRALAKRLESLLNENQALKEKVSFLEQSIVSLNEDLIQLRAAKTKALSKTEEATDDEEEIFI